MAEVRLEAEMTDEPVIAASCGSSGSSITSVISIRARLRTATASKATYPLLGGGQIPCWWFNADLLLRATMKIFGFAQATMDAKGRYQETLNTD